MTGSDLWALLPLLILGGGCLLLTLMLAFFRSRLAAFVITLMSFGTALGSLWPHGPQPHLVTDLLVFDRFGSYFMGLVFAAGLVVAALLWESRARRAQPSEEMYLLLLTGTLGAAVLVASRHFASFFLGLETLTISLYALIAYEWQIEKRLEAGIKYLVMGAVSSSFLLFGLALLYAELGTMQLTRVVALIHSHGSSEPILQIGLALAAVGIGFKMALVPFHMWTPDVYQGAPAPVAAFVATVSKGAVFAFLMRYFAPDTPTFSDPFFALFSVLAAVSMIGGNLLALLQKDVRRILAYSSIAHLGYLLVAFLSAGSLAVTATSYYLAAYFVTMLTAFGAISVLSDPQHRLDPITDFQGLYWKRPGMSAVFTASLLSLAGMPLTAGFLGKVYLAAAGVEQSLYWLVLILILTSAVALFYYLRIIVAMVRVDETETVAQTRRPSVTGVITLASLFIALFWLGVYPETLLTLIQATAGG